MRLPSRLTAFAVVLSLAACGSTSTPATDGKAVPLASPAGDTGANVVPTADAGAQAVLAEPAAPTRLEIALRGVESPPPRFGP